MTHVLTAADRCDRCGVQAYVRATLLHGDLHFCAHHWRTAKDAILPHAVAVLDETATLTSSHSG